MARGREPTPPGPDGRENTAAGGLSTAQHVHKVWTQHLEFRRSDY